MSGESYTGRYPSHAHRSLAEVDSGLPAAADQDVLAYLARRRRNCELLAANSAAGPDAHEQARHWIRLLEILSDEIAAGLHHGADGLAEFMGTAWEG